MTDLAKSFEPTAIEARWDAAWAASDAAAPTLDEVEARVGRDPEDPRPERVRGVVLMQCAIRADERVLGAIVRGIRVVRDPQGDVVHPSSVPFDQVGVGVGVP